MFKYAASIVVCLLILSHVLCDYYFQTDQLAKDKQHQFKKLVFHSMTFWVTSLLLTLPFFSIHLLILITSLSMTHLMIDHVKIIYDRNHQHILLPFLVDQMVHILLIFALYPLLKMLNYPWLNELMQHFPAIKTLDFELGFYYIELIVLVLMVMNGAGVIVGHIIKTYCPTEKYIFGQKLKKLKKKELIDQYFEEVAISISKDLENEDKPRNTGRIIGVFERLIIFTLVLFSQFTAITFVITAKSIARYKDLDEQISSEYYLIGTLASVFLALLFGLIAKGLKPY